MTNRWKALQAECERALGPAQDQLVHARDSAIVCDLAGYALLSIEGDDAEAFLHGQLSSDVLGLATDRCQLTSYNSPQGRVLAAALLWRTERGFLMQLPLAIADAISRRLSMYVLRSKVRIDVASDRFVSMGIGGPQADQVLAAAGVRLPDDELGIIRGQPIGPSSTIDYVMRLVGHRYQLLFVDVDAAIATFERVRRHGAMPTTFTPWRWLTVASGIAEIAPETQDEFVAQMLNYELIGAVSFSKGCYPGQEIVARTQYRGSTKRRTFLAHATDALEPGPRMAIFSESGGDQSIGIVVNAAPAPAGGFDLLACVHVELASGRLHLHQPDGPLIALLALPYPVPVPA